MKKRILCLVLALVLVVAAFTGCGRKKGADAEVIDVSVSAPNEFPIVEEKITLKVFMPKPRNTNDMVDNEFTKWYEEYTNVHIEWIVPTGDAQQAFNNMIAGGDYPDVIMDMGLSREQVMSLEEQGIVRDISKYIEKQGVNINKMFEEVPKAKEYVTFEDKIYGVPSVNNSYNTKVSNAMWVYEPWLKKLNIEAPTTTEEFYEMLKAFKEQDPNGNGKADEIPLAARGVSNYSAGIEAYLMSAFIPTEGNVRWYVENDKVKHVAVQDEYKEGLKYIKKLYDEGLLYEDTFIVDRTQLTAIGESDTPILGTSPGSYPGFFCNTSGTTPNYKAYVPILPLEGPKGVRATVPNRSACSGTSFIVTTSCKYPEVAVKWCDYFYSTEGRRKMTSTGLGTFRKAEPGELGISGKQALWTTEPATEEQIAKYGSGTSNYAWGGSPTGYTSFEESVSICNLGASLENSKKLYQIYETYSEFIVDTFKTITIAPEDADEYARYQPLTSQIDSYFAKFITGELSIEKDWDKYLKELDGLGINDYVALLQRNYDRENK
ncbi:MAG: extracellular solute-binding protein [Clostridia bacterium]|nr:extracellular solute-binding protein [Clostridia bacterium]